ncbi:MAG: hypothetical protein GW855_10590 [Erythrobacter sp.]|nr:hypothetical protein [Erythrobacter sp.]NCQ62824.1 hypothetical protein [Alphaproteobacteria bacterium]
MRDLETLAHAPLPSASRDLAAMQVLARELLHTDAQRLRPLKRNLSRDLAAALAGKALPWSEARTRFEARKLERLAAEQESLTPAPQAVSDAAEAGDESPIAKNALLFRLAAGMVALALWAGWSLHLSGQGSIAWDGGTGPAQTQNLFALYAPMVLALLATLIAITPSNRVGQA